MPGRIIGIAFLLLLGIQVTIAQTLTPYVLQPKTVRANRPFDLALKNSKFTCATQFSNQSIRAAGRTYYLTFKAVTQTGITCVVPDTLYGPVFQMPVLTTGGDSIYADQQAACAPLCAVPDMVQFADVLTVTPASIDSSWFIQPKSAMANKPFTLQLLNTAYGSCQTSFTHTSLTINQTTSGISLYANFVVVTDTTQVCTIETRPFGPSYSSTGMGVGKYPVYAAHHLACEYSTPACPVAVTPTYLADTLTVTAASPIVELPPRILPFFVPVDHLGVIQGYWINGRKAIQNP